MTLNISKYSLKSLTSIPKLHKSVQKALSPLHFKKMQKAVIYRKLKSSDIVDYCKSGYHFVDRTPLKEKTN